MIGGRPHRSPSWQAARRVLSSTTAGPSTTRNRHFHVTSASQSPSSSSSTSAQVQPSYDPSWQFDVNDIPALPRGPPPAPPSTRLEEYLRIRDSDFATQTVEDEDFDVPSDADTASAAFDPRPTEEDPPPLPTYDATLKKSRRRRRKAALEPTTEPLPLGTIPEDGYTRFDWRGKSLSRTAHAPGKHWFPEAWRNRVAPPITKLSELDPLWAELQRYNEQYVVVVAELTSASFLCSLRNRKRLSGSLWND